jgi:decaprenylphospho-beta-D-ribofuranose 2-oxidase
MKVSNWGKYPEVEASVFEYNDVQKYPTLIGENDHMIPRGMGRCYGDSALAKNILSTLKLNHLLAFDEEKGILTCEAGVTFEEVIRLFIPKGWFMPVSPGTKFITIGGAIASDIHGKNHHAKGTFSNHVYWMEIILPNGEIKKCSATENADLFALTCGGMGLTGLISKVCFQLFKVETSYIRQESIKAKNLDEIMKIFEDTSSWTNSVAWIDCLSKGKSLGKSIMTVGEWAKVSELKTEKQKNNPLKIHKDGKLFLPFDFPNFTINSLTVRAFNLLYYNKQISRLKSSIVHYETFYYPLDGILHWNRVYGKNGFTQYQFVLPHATSREGLIAIIEKIGQRGMGSFLTVLKLFGEQEENYIRFPKGGYTLAIDFKIDKKVWSFLDELDELVHKYGGRVYLTKDVRMKHEMLMKSYPQAQAFIEKIKLINPDHAFSSVQSERVGLTR